MSSGSDLGPEPRLDDDPDEPATSVILLHAEEAAVDIRKVETAIVRLSTFTSSRAERIDVDLAREEVVIERIEVGEVVESAPEIRQEGDVTVYPVVEEVFVVQRRFLLKEEVRVRVVKTTETHVETVTLRSQDVRVDRVVTTEDQQQQTGRETTPPAPTSNKEEVT